MNNNQNYQKESSGNSSCNCMALPGLKNAVGVAVLALSLLSLFLLAKSLTEFRKYAYTGKEYPAQTTISVSGKGEVVAVPDIATFTIGVSEEAMTVATAQKNSADKSNAITEFLKENDVDEKDIKTSGYNIYPRYEYTKDYTKPYPYPEKRVLAAYVVSQSFEVKLRNIADAGKILGGVGELGATDVSGLTFGFDKEKEMKEKARAEAIKKASYDAEKIAKDLGVKLVRIVNFYEDQGMDRFYGMGMGGDGAVALKSPVPAISTGEGKIVSNVNVVYEIR